jgi:hypothetical protein
MLSLPCAFSASSPYIATVLWSRTEALAGVRQAVVVESPSNSSTPTHTATALEGALVPSFAQRMQLQGLKFSGYAVSAAAGAASALQVLSEAVQKLSGSGGGAGKVAKPKGKVRSVRKEEALKAFGFHKLAVCLTHTDAGALSSGGGSGTSFSKLGLQLVGVDLLKGTVGWTSFPALPRDSGDPQVSFIKLVAGPAPVRHIAGTGAADSSSAPVSASASTASVTLVLGTADGRTFLWELLPSTGKPVAVAVGVQDSCASTQEGAEGVCALDLEQLESREQELPMLPSAQIALGSVSVFSSLVSLSNAVPVPVYSIVSAPSVPLSLCRSLSLRPYHLCPLITPLSPPSHPLPSHKHSSLLLSPLSCTPPPHSRRC